jgi:hypothetical protein
LSQEKKCNMLYEEKDIMVVKPYFARVIAQTPTVTPRHILTGDCGSYFDFAQ